MSQLTIPWREPIVDDRGLLTPAWVRCFNELMTRLGGTGDITDLSQVIALLETAQAMIDYQSVVPADTRVDEVLRRLEMLEGQIPPAPNLTPIWQKMEELERWQAEYLPPDMSPYARLSAATFAGTVTAPKFQTQTGSASAASATATTILTLPNTTTPSAYLIFANIGNVADAVNYGAYAVALTDGPSARIALQNNAPNQTITLSGLNVRSTQSSGTTQTINATATRIG